MSRPHNGTAAFAVVERTHQTAQAQAQVLGSVPPRRLDTRLDLTPKREFCTELPTTEFPPCA